MKETYSKEEVIKLIKKAWKESESQYFTDWGYDESICEEIRFINFEKKDINEFIKNNI